MFARSPHGRTSESVATDPPALKPAWALVGGYAARNWRSIRERPVSKSAPSPRQRGGEAIRRGPPSMLRAGAVRGRFPSRLCAEVIQTGMRKGEEISGGCRRRGTGGPPDA